MVKVVRLRQGVKSRVLSGCLTIYSKWILDDGGAEPGEEVLVYTHDGEEAGIGFYEGVGAVGVRLLTLGYIMDALDALKDNILRAIHRRRFYQYDSKRIVNADADMLPGLIIDLYRDIAVIQSTSIGMDLRIGYIKDILLRSGVANHVYVKNTQRSRLDAGLDIYSEWVTPRYDGDIVIREGEAIFIVDVEGGQKTGFYLDQRINRIELSRYIDPSMRILDLYSYTGGFGIHMLKAGAGKAVFIEEDRDAVEILERNLKLNGVYGRAEVLNDRVEKTIQELEDRYDFIVIDPPALAPKRDHVKGGIGKYRWILGEASRLAKGSLIFVSSCSYFITRDILRRDIIEHVYRDRRRYYLGGVRGASPDHMVDPSSIELDYLKAYLIYID